MLDTVFIVLIYLMAFTTPSSAAVVSVKQCSNDLIRAKNSIQHFGPSPDFHIQSLVSRGLTFDNSIIIDNATVHLTDVFSIGNGRVAAFALVDYKGGTYLRCYWRPTEGEAFRLLPAVNNLTTIKGQKQFDQPLPVSALLAPSKINEFLMAQVEDGKVRKNISDLTGLTFLQGAVRMNVTEQDYISYTKDPDNISNHVSKLALIDESKDHILSPGGRPVLPPDKVAIKEARRPNYKKLIRSYPTTEAGGQPVIAMVYGSNDGTLEYTFHKYANNMVIIFSVEQLHSGINNYGVRNVYLNTNELNMSLYAPGMDIPDKWRGPRLNRTSMFMNWGYIKNIPEIKAWYEFNKIPIPEIPPTLVSPCCKSLKLSPDASLVSSEAAGAYCTGPVGVAAKHEAPPEFRYDRPTQLEAVDLDLSRLTFSFGESYLALMQKYIDPKIGKANFTRVGEGASSTVFFLDTDPVPEFDLALLEEYSRERLVSQWIFNRAPLAIKIKMPNLDHGRQVPLGNLPVAVRDRMLDLYGQAINKAIREYALYDIATQLAERASFEGKKFIRVAKDYSSPELHENGISEMEAIHGFSVFKIQAAIMILRKQGSSTEKEISDAKKVLRWSQIPVNKIDEFERKIGALEEFYRRTHDDVIKYSEANNLSIAGNLNLENTRSPIGLDYNRGQNVIYDPATKFFVLVDW